MICRISSFLIQATWDILDDQNFNSRCEIFLLLIRKKNVTNYTEYWLKKFLNNFHKEFRLLVELLKWFDESSVWWSDWPPIPSLILLATNPSANPAAHPIAHSTGDESWVGCPRERFLAIKSASTAIHG